MTLGNYCDSVLRTLNIKIGTQSIKRVESHKYLGLHFDYNMKWDKHIRYIIKKTKYLIFVFAKIKNMMDTKTLMIIYYAFFHSLINYGVIAWGGAYDNNMKLIQSIQKKILKIINKNKFSQINPPLEIRKLFQLESISFHYASSRTKYINSASQTRNKSIQLPKSDKRISKSGDTNLT